MIIRILLSILAILALSAQTTHAQANRAQSQWVIGKAKQTTARTCSRSSRRTCLLIRCNNQDLMTIRLRGASLSSSDARLSFEIDRSVAFDFPAREKRNGKFYEVNLGAGDGEGLIEALKAGGNLEVTDGRNNYRFTLRGSSSAIGQVEARCGIPVGYASDEGGDAREDDDAESSEDGGGTLLDRLGAKGATAERGDKRRAEAFNPRAYSAKGRDIHLELSRRILAVHSELLDSDRQLTRWIEQEFPSRVYGRRGDRKTPITEKYYDGTAFEKNDAKSVLKGMILDAAETSPIKVMQSRTIRFEPGVFMPGRGIKLFGEDKESSYREQIFDLKYSGSRLKFYFDNAPDLGFMPATEDEARRLALLLKNNRNEVEIRQYITMTGISDTIEENRYDQTSYVALATLDAVDVVLVGRKDSEVRRDRVLYRWDLRDIGGEGGEGALAFARAARIATKDGRLLSVAGFGYGDKTPGGEDREEIRRGWLRYAYLAQAANVPDALADDNTLMRFATLYLPPRVKREIAAGRPLFEKSGNSSDYGLSKLSEFDRREVINELRRVHLGDLTSIKPEYPMPFVEVTVGVLEEYDFERKRFPVSWEEDSDGDPFSYLRGQFNIAGFVAQDTVSNYPRAPQAIDIDPESANALAEYLEAQDGNERRRVYLAMFGEAREPALRGEGARETIVFPFDVTRAALFADPGLTELITEAPVDTVDRSVDAGAVLLEAEAASPLLSEDTVALWQAKIAPEFFRDEDRVVTALVARQAAEFEARESGAPLFGDSILPRRMRRLEPSERTVKAAIRDGDLDRFAVDFGDIAEEASFDLVRYRFRVFVDPEASGSLALDLAQSILDLGVVAEAPRMEAARTWAPDAVELYPLLETADLAPVILALASDENWREVSVSLNGAEPQALGEDRYFDAELLFSVGEAGALSDETGKSLFAFTAKALKLTLTGADDKTASATLGVIEGAAGGDERGDLLVLGVDLGAGLEETKRALLDAAGWKAREYRHEGTGPGFYNGVRLSRLNDKGGEENDYIAIFEDSLAGENVVGAISRQVRLPEGVEIEDIRKAIKEQFGDPDVYYDSSSSSSYVWYRNSFEGRRFAGETNDPACPGSPAYIDRGSHLDFENLREGCGVVLIASLSSYEIKTVLANTDRLAAIIAERLDDQAQAEAQRKKDAKKKIKF